MKKGSIFIRDEGGKHIESRSIFSEYIDKLTSGIRSNNSHLGYVMQTKMSYKLLQ